MAFKYWPVIRNNTFFKTAVVVGISYIFYSLAGFLLPILLAIALAFALYPMVNAIASVRVAHGAIPVSYVFAIVLALLAFILFLFIVVGVIVLPLFGQMNEFLQKLPQVASQGSIQSLDAMINDPTKIPVLPSSFEMLVNESITWAMGFVGEVLRNLLKSSLDIVSNLIGLIIVPFLAFYFLKDWKVLRGMFINLFNFDVQDKAAEVIDEIGRTLGAYVNGLFKLSLLSSFVITIGTMSMGLEFPLVFGFVALLAETVPVVGPLMGAVPAIFIAYGQEPAMAFHVAIFYAVYYQLDANYIMPKIMGSKIDLHPVLVIGSLLIGAKLFGILGMVFAVPVAAVYRVLYKKLWHASEIMPVPNQMLSDEEQQKKSIEESLNEEFKEVLDDAYQKIVQEVKEYNEEQKHSDDDDGRAHHE